jgi:hypothetical protein
LGDSLDVDNELGKNGRREPEEHTPIIERAHRYLPRFPPENLLKYIWMNHREDGSPGSIRRFDQKAGRNGGCP